MSKSYFEELGTTEKGSQVLASARLRFRALSLLHEALAKSGFTQSELARRLGIRKSAVNQVLNSDGAMKLNTLAEYLDAMGYEAELILHPTGTLRLRAQMEAPRTTTVDGWLLLPDTAEECSTGGAEREHVSAPPAAVQLEVEGWKQRVTGYADSSEDG